MKKDQYFNLEVNLLNDDNIASMMSEMNAAEALGIYVMLLLHLRTCLLYTSSTWGKGEMNYAYALENMSIDKVGKQYAKVYRDLNSSL